MQPQRPRARQELCGAGMVEIFGWGTRLQAIAIADTNRDGWISLEEAKGKRCILRNLPAGIAGDATEIDYGSFEDLDGKGKPGLNPLFNPIYVDKDGKRIPFAGSLRYP